MGWLDRTALLLGEENIDILKRSRVSLLGLGGVGGAAAEALCRIGVGAIQLVDGDVVSESNLNRQLLATTETIGKPKAEVAAARLRSIAPAVELEVQQRVYLPEDGGFVYDFAPDVVADAIDMVTAKLHLAGICREKHIPLVACLGTGNRLDPSALRLGTIQDTKGLGCPLARVMRKELAKRGIGDGGYTVVYSVEPPRQGLVADVTVEGRHPPASAAFVPPAAGFLLAYGVVRALLYKGAGQMI